MPPPWHLGPPHRDAYDQPSTAFHQGAVMSLQLESVADRPDPGPVVGPPGSVQGPHVRDVLNRAFCVCGARWVQSMTCHPCRQGPHPPGVCVDGPGERIGITDTGRVLYLYPNQSEGRWCMCQHSPDPATLRQATERQAAYDDDVVAASFGIAYDELLAVTTTPLRTVRLGSAEAATRRPVPFLAPALAAEGERVSARLRAARFLGRPRIEGLYAPEPPADVPVSFCGDVPKRGAVSTAAG